MTGTPWYQRPLWTLDFETTGPNPLQDRIVSVALLAIEPEGTVRGDGITCVVDPGMEIPAEAAAVHGISTARAQLEGIPPREALQALAAWLACVDEAAEPLVIFNAPFDWTLIHAEAFRYGVPMPVGGPPGLALLDPLLLDRHFDKFRAGGRKLGQVAAHYGVPLADAHEAGADAIAAVGVLRVLAERYVALQVSSPADLHRAQVGWYESWKQGMNDFWRKKGKTERIAGAWPVDPSMRDRLTEATA